MMHRYVKNFVFFAGVDIKMFEFYIWFLGSFLGVSNSDHRNPLKTKPSHFMSHFTSHEGGRPHGLSRQCPLKDAAPELSHSLCA